MALNLNPPSHFVRPLKQGQNVLLPPSSFKKTSPERQNLEKSQASSKKTLPGSNDMDENQTLADVPSQRRKIAADQISSKEQGHLPPKDQMVLPKEHANRTPKDQPKSTGPDEATEEPWKSLALASRKLEELKEQNAELKRTRKRNEDQGEEFLDHSDDISAAPYPNLKTRSLPRQHSSSAPPPNHHRVFANHPAADLPPHRHQASAHGTPPIPTQYSTSGLPFPVHHTPSVPVATPQHPGSGTLYPLQLPGSGMLSSSPHPAQDHAQFLHLRHTADILTKQATEVAQLQTELDATKLRSTKEIAELKEKLRQVEGAKMEQVAELTAKLKAQEHTYTKKVETLQESNRNENTNLKEKIKNLEKSVQTLQLTCESERKELQSQLDNEQATHRNSVAKLKEQLRCKQEETSQMRTYFGEKKEAEEMASLWQQQKQHLESRIFELNKECESLQSTIQLLNVRLTSTNEMLAIQEGEVAKGKLDDIDDSKVTHGLLTRWREKVFSLMVQQKSQDIVLKKDAKDHQNMMTELQNKATSAHNQCLMLEHSIADKEAQLEMERGKMENLVEELDSVKETNNAMEFEMRNNIGTLMALGPVLRRFQNWHDSVEDKLRSGVTKLGGLEQRLLFATSRLDVLKGLLIRKNALLNVQLAEHGCSGRQLAQHGQDERQLVQHNQGTNQLQMTSDDAKIISLEEDQITDSRIPYAELVVEYDKVKREREQLAEKIQADARYFEETIQTSRQKLEIRITEAEDHSRELENTVDRMTQIIEEHKSHLAEKEMALATAIETINKLKIDIAKLQVGADKASKERCETLEAQYKTQLTEMEQRLNEARREHAKAVVSLRQLERQQSREKERSNEMLRLQEEQSRLEITRLENQLKDSDRDRNLLMATLRQEGLINQYKAQRNAAKKAPSESIPTPSNKSAQDKASKSAIQKDSLITMIADVKALTEEVLQDEDKIDTRDPES